MDDDLRKISKVMQISRKTMRIVKENIVFADVGVAVIAILNSMHTLRK